jgi:hypothetical protein
MTWLVGAIAAFVAAVLAQGFALRFLGVRHGIVAFVLVGVPIGLILVVSLLLELSLDRSISGVLLYAFLCEFWMFMLSVTFSSVAAKMMMHLRLRPMSLVEINQLFDNRAMIQSRIAWLADVGAAIRHDDHLVASGGGQRLVKLFEAFRSFFGHS